MGLQKLEKRVAQVERWEIERKSRAEGRAEVWKGAVAIFTFASILATLIILTSTGTILK